MLSRCLTEIFGHYLSNFQAPAKQAADKAIRLQPDLPEAHLALAAYYYHIFEYDSAATHFSIAQKGMPNNSDLWEEWGYMQKRQGLWSKAVAGLERSLELDPRDTLVNLEIARTFVSLREYKKAEHYFNRAVAIAPGWFQSYVEKSRLYIYWQGSTKKARKVLQDAPKELGLGSDYVCDFIEGNYEKHLSKLTAADTVFELRLNYFMTNAYIFGLMNRRQLMKTFYDSALIILKRQAPSREGDPDFHATLSRAYAGSGRKEAAIREALQAVEILPVSKSAVSGPEYLQNLAKVYTMVGEYDKAINELEYLLSIPCGISVPLLRLDPTWAPLRNHPRFKKLIDERA
jgi:tetratricopeptide (TPR) repeat protein